MNWIIITALATVIMAISIIFTSIFAIFQLREIKKARKFDAFLNISQFLQREDIRKSRVSVLRDKWENTLEQCEALGLALSSYEALWYMIFNNLVEKELVLAQYRQSIIITWEKFKPVILEYRKKYGENFRKEIELLYNLAKKRI